MEPDTKDASVTKHENLNVPKLTILGLQHMFAMFGATILVPLLSGLSVQVTLVGVGVGTLIFHFFAKGRVPAFLGSSFAFLVGIRLITDPSYGLFAHTDMTQPEKLSYATGGIMVSGLMYVLFAIIIKIVGTKTFMKFVPTTVTAPAVILIGIMLAPFAISQSAENLLLAGVTLGLVVIASSWGKGMIKIIPILIGIAGAYVLAVILHNTGVTNPDGSPIIDFANTLEGIGSGFIGLPPFMLPRFNILAILIMLPFALATIAEHIGDMVALSNIAGEDYMEEPGLARTLLGDGVASMFSGFIGGPASTTYGENVGVVALTKILNPRVVQVAAIFATVLAFSPVFAALIYSIPSAIIGGASFMLYGMIAAVGVRNLVEHQVDLSKSKNLTIIALMLVTGLGLRFGPTITFTIGYTDVPIDRLGVAIAVILGVCLNIILPEENKQDEANEK